MKALCNFFFPFAQKDTHNLSTMRWHRLAVVLFTLCLLCTFFSTLWGRGHRFGRGEYGMMMKMDGKMMHSMMRDDRGMMKEEMKTMIMSGKMDTMMANHSGMACSEMSGCTMMSGSCDGSGCAMMTTEKMTKTMWEKTLMVAKKIWIALAMTIIRSYILQILYYKVFLYVVYGCDTTKK